MPKIVQFTFPPGGSHVQLADNLPVALDIETTAGEDFILIDTETSAENMVLCGGNFPVLIGSNQRGPRMRDGHGSSAVPAFPVYTFRGDTDTGMTHLGTSNDNSLSLVAGGVEGIRITKDESLDVVYVGIGGAADDVNNTLLQLNGDSDEAELAFKLSGGTTTTMGYRGQAKFSIDANGGIQFRNQGGSKRAEIDSSGNFTMLHTTTVQDDELVVAANTADANSQSLVFTKSRNATDGSHTIVNDNDVLGEIEFKGSDGNSFAAGAKISARVNGTPGDGDMPSELVLSTSADGSEAPSERVVINASGKVGIGVADPDTVLHVHDDAGAHITISGNASTDDVGISFESLSGTRYASVESNGNTGVLKIRSGSSATGGGYSVQLASGGGATENIGLILDSTGEVSTGGELTPQCAPAGGLHVRTGTGSTLSAVHTIADDLVVEGATNAGATFITGGTSSSTYIMFADDDDNQAGALFYGHGQDRFEIRAGGVWISTFSSTGQVNGAELAASYLFQAQDGEMGIVANSADANGQSLVFTKSRNATDGQHTVVNDDDVLGEIEFKGSDGNTFAHGAKIIARVDGTPGDGDMPTELVFAVSADGSETPTERLRLASTGALTNAGVIGAGDGNANSPGFSFRDENDVGMYRPGTDILGFSTAGTHRMAIDSGGKIFTGATYTTAGVATGGIQIITGPNSLGNVNGSFNDLIIEGDGPIGMTFLANANSGIRFQKDANNDHHGITFDSGTTSIRTRLGSTDRFYVDDAGRVKLLYSSLQFFSGLGADDATTEPLYLADSGATLVIDVRKGNYGDVTLTADVTAIKFFHAPNDGNVYTMTAKIKQHASSAKTIDYSDSAVTVFSDTGSTSVTGEMKFSGGVHHTMSTTTGAIDIVQFTIFPDGSTFDVYASVIGQNFS